MFKKGLALLAATVCISSCGNPVEDTVRQSLIDGESAEFRGVERCSGDSSITTGEVNAKNRMGAYVGFEPFFVKDGQVYYTSTDGVMGIISRCYEGADAATTAAVDAEGDAGGPEAAASLESNEGNWTPNVDTNPLDDSKVITAHLSSESGQSRFGGPVSLVARCESNKTELYVIWEDYLGDDSRDVYDEYKNVEVRVGTSSARSERWGISTDKKATFAPNSVDLLKSMKGADRLVLQTTPYNENPITAVFPLKGMESAIGPIAKECGWKL